MQNPNEIINIIGPVNPRMEAVDPRLFSIFVDGGSAYKNSSFSRSLSIGDGDSCEESMDIKMDIRLERDKIWGDLYFAVKEMPKLKARIAKLRGFVGGRLDHQILLIGDLLRLSQDLLLDFQIYDEDTLKMEVLAPGEINRNFKGEFSLFTLFEQRILYGGDCQYPKNKEYPQLILPFSTNGLGNFCDSNLSLKTEKSVCLYYL